MTEIDKLAENAKPIKTSLTIPTPILEYLYNDAEKQGIGKQKYLYKGIKNLLPNDLNEILGKEIYENLLEEIRYHFKQLASQDMMKFCDIIRMNFLTREPEDKNVEYIYKLISENPNTVDKNSLINLLMFKDEYLNQLKHDVFDEEMKQLYRESTEKALFYVDNLINKNNKFKDSKTFL